ncbi:hypothetical protein ACFWY5_05045 [Nonomuraea sp. NPDC059007]|uniref:hypothetical protein n=1 Tax=Nonomuraea sp. NPDC059007 TaxID=3346692 RepID=UPI0036791A27
MDEPAGSATELSIATCRRALEYSLAEQVGRGRRLTCSQLHYRDVRYSVVEALGGPDVEALVKLFVHGYGVVSPQDWARVGQLLSREQM